MCPHYGLILNTVAIVDASHLDLLRHSITEFHSPVGLSRDLTVAQFVLDYQHPTRPVRPYGTPWLIGDRSGREIDYEEVSLLKTNSSVAP
jgi:hypothetical protein